MISIKKKYSKSLRPGFEDDFHVLEDAVSVFQEALNIKQNVCVLLKKKNDEWGMECGVTFFNNSTNKISCHVYVHRHSTLLGTLIFVAHEMVHAWQIDSNQPNKSGWEEQAEELSLGMVRQYHIKQFPEREASLAAGEVKMARLMAH